MTAKTRKPKSPPIILDWWGNAYRIGKRNYERWLTVCIQAGRTVDPSEHGAKYLGSCIQVTEWESDECTNRLQESLDA